MKRNRWLIALSAMGLHLCIGSVYAWSVLTKPIMESMGFTLKETTWTFSLAILFLGGEPEVAFEKAPVRATSLREMFEADLKDEENAIRFYTNIQRRRRKPAPKVTSVRGCSLSRLCSTRKATRPGSRPSST